MKTALSYGSNIYYPHKILGLSTGLLFEFRPKALKYYWIWLLNLPKYSKIENKFYDVLSNYTHIYMYITWFPDTH